jgi:methionine-rich copper-binding protein CopC
MRRLVPSLLLACLAMLAVATPAFAHTELISSDPAKGAQLAAAPTQLTLTFSEAASVDNAEISVTAPDGAKWTVGTITARDTSLIVPLQGSGPAGRYMIDYTVTALDGDAVSGQIPFTLAAPAQPPVPTTAAPAATTSGAAAATQTSTPASSAATSTTATSASGTVANTASGQSGSDGGIPWWVWILAAVVLIGVGVFVALRTRRGGEEVS